jgi:hypothetical protein
MSLDQSLFSLTQSTFRLFKRQYNLGHGTANGNWWRQMIMEQSERYAWDVMGKRGMTFVCDMEHVVM